MRLGEMSLPQNLKIRQLFLSLPFSQSLTIMLFKCAGQTVCLRERAHEEFILVSKGLQPLCLKMGFSSIFSYKNSFLSSFKIRQLLWRHDSSVSQPASLLPVKISPPELCSTWYVQRTAARRTTNTKTHPSQMWYLILRKQEMNVNTSAINHHLSWVSLLKATDSLKMQVQLKRQNTRIWEQRDRSEVH